MTGAATGIGRATAERLTREGAMVVAAVADEDQRIEIASASAFDVQVLDVRSEVNWDRVVAHVETEHGGGRHSRQQRWNTSLGHRLGNRSRGLG